jgi:hypothetical protein
MKNRTRISVAGIEGFLFFGVGEIPYFVFVPACCLAADGSLDRNAYLANRWPYANNYANPAAAGSHIWPDMERPAPVGDKDYEVFLARLTDRILGVR